MADSTKEVRLFSGVIEAEQKKNPFVSVTKVVTEAMEQAIMALQLEPGEKLNISKLAAGFNVSTTTIREAIVALAEKGMISIEKKGDGAQNTYKVYSMTAEDIEEIFTFREALEAEAAFKLAMWPEKIDLDELERLNDCFRESLLKAKDKSNNMISAMTYLKEATDYDRQFHDTIIRSTGNKYIINAYNSVLPRLRNASYRSINALALESEQKSMYLVNQHKSIINSIRQYLNMQAADYSIQHVAFCMQSIVTKEL